ncbi:MAG: MFS transporter [Rhodomicrobium sp.]
MTSAIRHYATGLSRNTFLLAFASLFADISTEMLYPILPVFLTQTLKASGSIVGLVDGFAQAAQNIVQGFSGALSDKLQKRKPVALVGYLLAAVAKPLMGLATSWQGVFGARLLDRLSAGTRSAPRDALIASSVEEKDRGRAFGLEGVGDNAGAFLGPLLAVFLLYALHIGIIFLIAYLGFALTQSVLLIAALFVFLRIVSGDIPRCRQSLCRRFRAGAATCQRYWLVQHDRRPVAAGRERCCGTALESRRPCESVLLRCSLCLCWQHRAVPVGSGGA